MIKALFFDIDGTLITSAGRISKKTIQALKACREKGIKVFTATGRGPALSKMLKFDEDERDIIRDGGVFCNGACIRINDTLVYTFLSEEAVKRSLEILPGLEDMNVVVYMENERHSFRYSMSEQEYADWGVDNIDELVPFEPEKFSGVIKIAFWLPVSLTDTFVGQLKEAVGELSNIYAYYGREYALVEIVDKNSNKMLGIKRIAALFGWEDDEVAVFGDDCNDMEMLSGFRNSFAMGNARDEVKACATYVTLSNNEEGIYHALHNILEVI